MVNRMFWKWPCYSGSVTGHTAGVIPGCARQQTSLFIEFHALGVQVLTSTLRPKKHKKLLWPWPAVVGFKMLCNSWSRRVETWSWDVPPLWWRPPKRDTFHLSTTCWKPVSFLFTLGSTDSSLRMTGSLLMFNLFYFWLICLMPSENSPFVWNVFSPLSPSERLPFDETKWCHC